MPDKAEKTLQLNWLLSVLGLMSSLQQDIQKLILAILEKDFTC